VARGAHDPLSTIYPLYGGVLLVIKSEDDGGYGTTVFIPDETKPVQIAVPNGVYHAGAIGWEGSASPPCIPGSSCHWAEGQSKCGIAFSDTPFALTGQAMTIPIVMAAGVCQNGYGGNSTPFADVAYNPVADGAFPTLTFSTPDSSYISGHYLAVWLNTYDMAQGVKTRKSHQMLVCVPVSSGTGTTQLRLPVGKSDDDGIFSYTITYHPSDSSCANTPDGVAEFDKGFVFNPTGPDFTSASISYSSNVNTITLN
jgi:hypothetical protein